ncbi:hypothetical protein ASPWEDRAFT_188360 [Aspergillus wentii DTO 134E9]|uniref:Oxidoreductase n=1 Tax=Aspergillus wentii DTO 134E9 TaxID=1073089 RepID=A0A1L9R4W4_ASPWE|nr:uncharacterized protein ASPWEDRAFT_188360 [Aspergillus wentii DTO 134E9]OJJ29959.1 hypothetical protein ASPWEDRAFT_188360 [Aspergillus wentii DTO 134E9]
MAFNKVYLIIGSASGMGLATAKSLLSQGARLAVCDISESNLDALVTSLPASQQTNILARAVDVVNASVIRDFLQSAKAHFGRLDGIANFAGTPGHELGTEGIWETSVAEYDYIMNVNVRGLFNVLNVACAPGFMEDGASIVHIGSIFSVQGFKNGAVFAASKHAAVGMIKSVAKEMGERLRVNCILPGVIDTPMHQANLDRVKDFTPTAPTPIPRSGTAQEIAEVAMFLLSEKSSFVTGVAWNVDGGAIA